VYYTKIGLALADDEKKVKSSYVFFHCAEYRQLIGVSTFNSLHPYRTGAYKLLQAA